MPQFAKIVPCLWFDHQAEEAAAFYVSVFDSSRITRVIRHTEAGQEIHGQKPGSVLMVAFELAGQPFTALNGGPRFHFSHAVSLQVICDTQQELDHHWNLLAEGGDPAAQQCGWLKDKFGLSWQIVPRILPDLLADPSPTKAARTMNALLAMKKLDVAALLGAAEQER